MIDKKRWGEISLCPRGGADGRGWGITPLYVCSSCPVGVLACPGRWAPAVSALTLPVSPSVCGGGWRDLDWLCAVASGFFVSCFAAAFLVALSAYYADVVYGVLSAFGPLDDVVCFCTVGLLAFAVIKYDITKRTCVLSLCLCFAFGLCCDALPLGGSCAACRHGVLVVVCCAAALCVLHCVCDAQHASLWCGECGVVQLYCRAVLSVVSCLLCGADAQCAQCVLWWCSVWCSVWCCGVPQLC